VGFQIGSIVKAIYSKLSADVTLNNLITNIYVSSMPKKATFPCVVIGDNDLSETPFNAFGKRGKETLVNIYIYDSSNSDLTNISIAQRIDSLLEAKSDLTIDGCNHIQTILVSSLFGYDVNSIEGTEVRAIRIQYKITTDET